MNETISPTVDIYERDSTARELMQHWLSEAGYCVREHGGSRAQPNSPVDLVILATQLPTQQTLGVIRTMRLFYPTTAFLVLANRSADEQSIADTRVGRSRDATRVLCKPLTRRKLLEAVRTVTSRGAGGSATPVSIEMNA
jgi:DNA-binding response OmpR family regulator